MFNQTQRSPIYLPFVDYQVEDTWVPPLAAANFRTLVRLSDVVNWRHTGTNWLILYRSFTIMQKDATTAAFQMSVGSVLSVSPVDCVVAYLEPMSLNQLASDPSRIVEERYFDDFPLSLRPTAPAGGLFFGVDAASIVAETVINSATNIPANAAGVAATPPAVGDLIFKVLRTSAAPGPTCRVRHLLQYRGA
jgi:hypothetical protein